MMHTDSTVTLSDAARQPAHEHAWMVESAHNTSEGRVLYVRCAAGCNARRIDLQGPLEVPPSPASVEVGLRRG